MSDKKYLYYPSSFNGLQRSEIIRETACYFFIEYGRREKKINKKTLWSDYVRYAVETPELDSTYIRESEYKKLYSKFIDKLEVLKGTTDEATMKKVLEIEVPK